VRGDAVGRDVVEFETDQVDEVTRGLCGRLHLVLTMVGGRPAYVSGRPPCRVPWLVQAVRESSNRESVTPQCPPPLA
jgi:hypothetical protein